ncbi:MAG: nucleotidyltransferase family protein [Nanobdellota archaeon]
MDAAIVYMVAGMSSRFGGKIKQFARVGPEGETLIEYSLKQALNAGFTKIIFIVGNKTEEPFREMFGNNYKGIPIFYSLQTFDDNKRERPWGTVDALCSAREEIDCPFVVCNGDDIYGEETFKILFNHLKDKKDSATVGYKLKNVVPDEGKVNRGIFEANQDNTVKSLNEVFEITQQNIEEKGLSDESLCSMNVFALESEVVKKLDKILKKFKKEHKEDRKIECLLPNELGNLINSNELIIHLYPTNSRWFGVTNPQDEDKVKEELKKYLTNH